MRISEILEFLKEEDVPFTFTGDSGFIVEGFSSLNHYKPGSFTWIKTQQNIPEEFVLSRLTLVFVSQEVDAGPAPNVIRTSESKRAFFSSIEHFYAREAARPAVGQFTYLSPKVKLGKNVRIGHNCTLDGDITIGDNTLIWNDVVIVGRVNIGRSCEIQSGTIIGHDGFSYSENAAHEKTMILHFGGVGVSIGDNVQLGMNNVIARGVIDDTVIGDGTKFSDLCHIGHNSRIGRNCAIINTAVFGSCVIGDNAYIVYSVVKNQSRIGAGAFVGMGSNVISDVPDGITVVGNPAKPLIKEVRK